MYLFTYGDYFDALSTTRKLFDHDVEKLQKHTLHFCNIYLELDGMMLAFSRIKVCHNERVCAMTLTIPTTV